MNKDDNLEQCASMSDRHSYLAVAILLTLWVQSVRPADGQQVNNGTVPLGASLLAGGNQTWVSTPNGAFAFGFYPLDDNTAPAAARYKLGIWYAGLPVRTVVWGLASNSGPVGAGARVTLTTDGNLTLFGANSSQGSIWSSHTDGLGVAGASLSDAGNFVLLNGTGAAVWQSWDVPLDTLLPGQTLPQSGVLTAGASPHLANASVSPYKLSMETNGDLSLSFNGSNRYWTSGTGGGSQAAIPNRASLDAFGAFQLLNTTGVTAAYLSNDYGIGPLRRVTLTPDGNLVTFSWNGTASNWTATWQAWPNECEIYGWCGQNGLCSYTEAGPACSCLPGYGALSPASPRQGCELLAPLGCAAGLKMVPVANTLILQFVSDYLISVANRSSCAQQCLADTLECLASTLENDGAGFCREKRTKFMSVYRSPVLAAESYVKLCVTQAVALTPPPDPSRGGGTSAKLTVAVGCLAGLAGLLLLMLAWPYLAPLRRRPGTRDESAAPSRGARPPSAAAEYVPGAPVRFSYRELQRGTRNFSEKLGAGGFGTVYKGVLADGTVVAVKQLEDVVEQGEREFRTEVAVIGSTHHVNLVRLHGFCTERAHRLLVYEYLANGSLDNYLVPGSGGGATTTTTSSSASSSSGSAASSAGAPPPLDWATRFAIALGTARGVTYLHEECRECIVHCDIKPENILLDEHFCPKVSDFGLARLLGLRGRRDVTAVRGTRGYLAPEWGARLPLTAKADVFSYGVVLLELVAGRRALDAAGEVEFPAWAYRELIDGGLVDGVEERAARHRDVEARQVEQAVRTAFWCIQDEAAARPTMGKVVQMLEGTIPVEPPPAPLSIRRTLGLGPSN